MARFYTDRQKRIRIIQAYAPRRYYTDPSSDAEMFAGDKRHGGEGRYGYKPAKKRRLPKKFKCPECGKYTLDFSTKTDELEDITTHTFKCSNPTCSLGEVSKALEAEEYPGRSKQDIANWFYDIYTNEASGRSGLAGPIPQPAEPGEPSLISEGDEKMPELKEIEASADAGEGAVQK